MGEPRTNLVRPSDLRVVEYTGVDWWLIGLLMFAGSGWLLVTGGLDGTRLLLLGVT